MRMARIFAGTLTPGGPIVSVIFLKSCYLFIYLLQILLGYARNFVQNLHVFQLNTSGGYTNGIRYEGTDGWIFVSRGNYMASASDPVDVEKSAKALDASDPAILKSDIKENEIHLYESKEQHGNWLDCIQSRKQPISPVEIGHRACSVCLISHIAMKIPGVLQWDPKTEKFINNDLANSMLSRPQRYPYGTDSIKR